jgi:rhodanese-related sulfurtransferase
MPRFEVITMKTTCSVILAVLLIAGIALAAAVKPLTVKDAKTLIDRTPNLYILDVRTPDEYRQARMKNSVLIPVNDLERRVNEVPKNRPILVICAVGARSKPASDFLVSKGYKEVYHLNDGLVAWYRAGLPIER